jgi:hypothetical protein
MKSLNEVFVGRLQQELHQNDVDFARRKLACELLLKCITEGPVEQFVADFNYAYFLKNVLFDVAKTIELDGAVRCDINTKNHSVEIYFQK